MHCTCLKQPRTCFKQPSPISFFQILLLLQLLIQDGSTNRVLFMYLLWCTRSRLTVTSSSLPRFLKLKQTFVSLVSASLFPSFFTAQTVHRKVRSKLLFVVEKMKKKKKKGKETRNEDKGTSLSHTSTLNEVNPFRKICVYRYFFGIYNHIPKTPLA